MNVSIDSLVDCVLRLKRARSQMTFRLTLKYSFGADHTLSYVLVASSIVGVDRMSSAQSPIL